METVLLKRKTKSEENQRKVQNMTKTSDNMQRLRILDVRNFKREWDGDNNGAWQSVSEQADYAVIVL